MGRQAHIVQGRLSPLPDYDARGFNMDRWRVELGKQDKYLGIVEAEDEEEAVEVAIEKFRVPAAQRHKVMVSKSETEKE